MAGESWNHVTFESVLPSCGDLENATTWRLAFLSRWITHVPTKLLAPSTPILDDSSTLNSKMPQGEQCGVV